MPEGPTIILAKEDLLQFKGLKILSASGSASIDMKKLKNKTLTDLKTFGKQLLLCFDGFTVSVHFLMFGKYYANSSKAIKPRLALKFGGKRELNFYTCAVKMIDGPVEDAFDWSADILNDHWSLASAKKKLDAIPGSFIADALLDQDIFAGLGNIIKNEILYRMKIHPLSLTGKIPAAKRTALLKEVIVYAHQFLDWKRAYKFTAHWEVYTRKKCKRDGTMIKKEYLGKTKRGTFFCPVCQVLYH